MDKMTNIPKSPRRFPTTWTSFQEKSTP
jgi:hypothetical protein